MLFVSTPSPVSTSAPLSQVATVRKVLDSHFPRCVGTNVFQGDKKTPGTCGCDGMQHWYTPSEVAAIVFTFYPDVHAELCGSINSPNPELLYRCLHEIEGAGLNLNQRRINGKSVQKAILGVRLSPHRSPSPQTFWVC